MGKKSSLVHQAQKAVCACFVEGAVKKDAPDYAVTSYDSRFDLTRFARMVMPDIKAMCPECKDIEKLPKWPFEAWLAGRVGTCSWRTLEKYADLIEKTGKCVNHTVSGASVEWSSGLIVPKSIKYDGATIRTNKGAFERSDYEKIIAWGRRDGARSKAVDSWELSDRLGLRLCETTRVEARCYRPDILGKYGHGTFHVLGTMGKNGRGRVIDIRTADDAAFIRNLCTGKASNERLGMDQRIRERMQKTGMDSHHKE